MDKIWYSLICSNALERLLHSQGDVQACDTLQEEPGISVSCSVKVPVSAPILRALPHLPSVGKSSLTLFTNIYWATGPTKNKHISTLIKPVA